MTNKLIYLDNNATTKVDEKVLEEMMPFFKEEYANPSSMYDFSRKSSNAIKEARVKIRDFVNAQDEKEIIFTSCGSESANTAIRGVLNYNKTKKHIITSKVEHPCVLNLYQAQNQNHRAKRHHRGSFPFSKCHAQRARIAYRLVRSRSKAQDGAYQ